ncbi:hypothetical protein L2E82_37102 [Cichorium intybus]|uniref:Uncharacterized protein n=1 Tax=Cichorium intybus TaxID=13427 RepID=A0ACB9AED0_CICIN|nr:hypothetical protein L2E82_37102 [Cichorium intybus]
MNVVAKTQCVPSADVSGEKVKCLVFVAISVTYVCLNAIKVSELETSGQVLKRTRVGVEDSSRAPTIESTGSAFESGVGRHLQLLVNKFYIRSVSDDCSTIMMKAEDVCERISRNWDPVTGWHNLEEDIRELKQYIDVKSIRTDIRSCAVVCVLTVKPLERKAVYSVGPLILVVGTTY